MKILDVGQCGFDGRAGSPVAGGARRGLATLNQR
jgi:hypothetical protein